jgi:predicted nicotinamide N-methyase
VANTVLGDPFWAFAWAGGQGVARFVLDTPSIVENKRVFDLATGSGLIALAAATQGATQVIANDIDPFCAVACELNAELNQVQMHFDGDDRIGTLLSDIDVLVAGDICYEEPLASQVLSWLKALGNQGVEVYVGDPGRASFKRDGLECVANYSVDYTNAWDDEDVRRTKVFRVLP